MSFLNGGSGEIRTHGTLTYDSFQDCYLKPLGHTSNIYNICPKHIYCQVLPLQSQINKPILII